MSNEWWVEDAPTTHIEKDGWGVFDANGNLLCVCPAKITALAIASMSGMVDPYQRGFEDGRTATTTAVNGILAQMVGRTKRDAEPVSPAPLRVERAP